MKQDRIQRNTTKKFYDALQDDDGATYYKRISNFILTVERCFINIETGEIAREVMIEGDMARGPFMIDAETSLTLAKFQAFVFGKGVYFFEGTKKDLTEIWKLESQSAKIYIQESPYVGYLRKFGLYLFEDVAIDTTGKETLPQDGIFYLNEQTALSFRRFTGAAGRLPNMVGTLPDGVNLTFVQSLIQNSLKERGLLCLAWVMCVALLPEITTKFKKFPHLFLSGKTQSGKTTLASWIMAFFGIDAEGLSILESTPYAINEMLNYYSGLPVWLDEYRVKDDRCEKKNDTLKNVYDRQGSMKGKLGRQIVEIEVNGCLLITGEEFPAIHSVLSRCICIELSERHRGTKDDFDTVCQYASVFPQLFKEMLKLKTEHKLTVFFRYQKRLEKALQEQVKDPRIAFNYSLMLAAYRVFLGYRRDPFVSWGIAYAVKDRQTKDADKLTHQFLSDVVGMIQDGVITCDNFLFEGYPAKLYLALQKIFREWEKQSKQRGSKITYVYKTLVRDLKDETFFVESESIDHKGFLKHKRINGITQRCVCLDLSKIPFSIKEDFENLFAQEKPFETTA